MASQDPFRDPQTRDPYSQTLDSGNPFADQNQNVFKHANDSFAEIDTGAGAGGGGGGGNLSERERDLQRREAALARQEAEIADQRRQLDAKANNWPPFFPLVHHDISELPEQHRTVGKLLYFQWLALALTLILNMVGCVLLLVGGAAEGGADMGASVMYVPVIGAASFFAWYRPIYLGLSRTEGRAMAFWFYIYFLFAGFHLLFSAYMAVGIPSTGSAGLINTISCFGRGAIVSAVFGVIASTGWVLQAAGGGILYKRIWDFKNGNGDITFQAASDQFKSASIKTIILHQSRV